MGSCSVDETRGINFYCNETNWRKSSRTPTRDPSPEKTCLSFPDPSSGTLPNISSELGPRFKRKKSWRKKQTMLQPRSQIVAEKVWQESYQRERNKLNEKNPQNFNSNRDRNGRNFKSNYCSLRVVVGVVVACCRNLKEFFKMGRSPLWIQLWILLFLLPSPGTQVRSEPQPLYSNSQPRPLPLQPRNNSTSISSLTAGFSIPGIAGSPFNNPGRIGGMMSISTSSTTTSTLSTSGESALIDEDYPFENNTYSNTTVPLGDTAFLKCTVKNLGEREVFWIRRRDMHIISVGKNIYSNDERFHILNFEGSDDWVLQIKYVQKRDNGSYECQVSTGKGIASYAVHVFVAVPEAFILGNGEYHIQEGSTINLVCIVEKSPKPPDYIFWYHNDRMINYDKDRNLRIQTETGSKTHSRLIIDNAQVSDSGNYTCHISNADPASTLVYISQGDKMAAIQRRKSAASMSNYFSDFLLLHQLLSIALLLIN